MSPIHQQYKDYGIIAFIIAVGFVVAWYGIIPLQKDIRDKMDASQRLLTDREIRETLVAGIVDLRDQKTLVSQKEDRLNIVIHKDDIVDLIKVIEGLAKDSNVAISIDSKDQLAIIKPPAKPAAKDAPKDAPKEAPKNTEKSLLETLPSDKRLGIAIKLTGSYDHIVGFVRKLESMPYATDIVAVSLVVSNEGITKDRVNGNMFTPVAVLSTDASPMPDAPAPPAEPLPLEATLDTVVYVRDN